ncbi:MAG: SHOCT domain-containing protein [Clostridiales bacterium]|nr:SHOCT domain-containing protein [Clostridiales bacterium]
MKNAGEKKIAGILFLIAGVLSLLELFYFSYEGGFAAEYHFYQTWDDYIGAPLYFQRFIYGFAAFEYLTARIHLFIIPRAIGLGFTGIGLLADKEKAKKVGLYIVSGSYFLGAFEMLVYQLGRYGSMGDSHHFALSFPVHTYIAFFIFAIAFIFLASACKKQSIKTGWIAITLLIASTLLHLLGAIIAMTINKIGLWNYVLIRYSLELLLIIIASFMLVYYLEPRKEHFKARNNTNDTPNKISEMIQKRPTNTTVVQNVSNADELAKFKDLLDKGIITQEEFDAKKKQLLGL